MSARRIAAILVGVVAVALGAWGGFALIAAILNELRIAFTDQSMVGIGFLVGPVMLAFAALFGGTALALWRSSAAARPLGVISGLLLALAGIYLGASTVRAWDVANNPPPGVVFASRDLDPFAIALAVALLVTAGLTLWAAFRRRSSAVAAGPNQR